MSETRIKDAIVESDERNKIVDVDVKSIDSAMAEIRSAQGDDEIDSVDTTDADGRLMREVWTTGGPREWRIHLHLARTADEEADIQARDAAAYDAEMAYRDRRRS